jgi:hypothetical protein
MPPKVKEVRMPDVDRDFLIEVFKETNSHIRATDRKSLLVTGAYISLFSLFLSSVSIGRWSDSTPPPPWVQIGVQGFFLMVGSSIFVMQQWYRAWKEHYIDVCIEIRKKFMPEVEHLIVLPYWLRYEMYESRISIDNLLKYLTTAVNFVLVFLICYDLMNILPNRNLAILIVAAVILAYVGLIYATDRVIRKSRRLFA